MEETGEDEQWVTVRDFSERFGLGRYQSNAVSGFLRRLECGPFRSFPYVVARILPGKGTSPAATKRCRYLLQLRQGAQPMKKIER